MSILVIFYGFLIWISLWLSFNSALAGNSVVSFSMIYAFKFGFKSSLRLCLPSITNYGDFYSSITIFSVTIRDYSFLSSLF